ncbi:MAG: molybdate ABC transporter permease subunit [Candidatus Cyclobacteriaceae bacterium M3_2C_046]
MAFSWEPFWLSLKLAIYTTTSLFVLGLLLVYLLHFFSFKLKPVLKALVSLPLVLPPSVIGYYLLLSFNPNGFLGSFFQGLFNIRLAFSFTGLVVASIIFSLPFMINPILSGLENLPKSLQEAAFILGKSRWITFVKVLLPNIRSSVMVALVMTFAHTIGEFGVVLIIGGNIPGQTRVASVAIYNEIEALNYASADLYSIILLLFSFFILLSVYIIQGYKNVGVV